MRIRRLVFAAAVGLACMALLSSCTFFASGPGGIGVQLANSNTEADGEMQLILNDAKHHDAAALKALFSKAARARATDLDSGINDFLDFFPTGFKSLGEPAGGPGEEDTNDNGSHTQKLICAYKVSVKDVKYELYFLYYPVNEVDDTQNVGLWAIGVEPWYSTSVVTHPNATNTAFETWASGFSEDNVDHYPDSPPSIYIYTLQNK